MYNKIKENFGNKVRLITVYNVYYNIRFINLVVEILEHTILKNSN